jgi:hypothetical protein
MELTQQIERMLKEQHESGQRLVEQQQPLPTMFGPVPHHLDPVNNDNGEEVTVWEAAKRGDMNTTLAIIDRGDATPNDVELLNGGFQGRTPLYWSCFVGHVDLVRELLARGGIDADGTAYLAITSRETADDERDLMFNPDDNIYSDYVDYENETNIPKPTSVEDDTVLIRSMLLAARSPYVNRRHLPSRLYESAAKEDIVEMTDKQPQSISAQRMMCVVCLEAQADAIPTPCGHIACCVVCLTTIRDNRDGCPICRGRIVAIVQRGGRRDERTAILKDI